ncbi:AraC family transcriptional regulator [Candidatus Merdisoma sp. JLR.KK006]|uniref:AraC family transcriptional regulator n=1 Tax=Candidatus Merdisoma sp. JLR.KK006 TaxID=3112626 RepID=UPI002FF2AD73
MALLPCDIPVDKHGRELKSHDTAFPIGCYLDNLTVDAVPWHWHNELEAVIIAEGSCTFFVDSEKYILKKGDGIFVNSNFLHTVLDNDCINCQLHSITFHPRLVGGSLDSVFWQKYLQPLLTDPSFRCIFLSQRIAWQKEALEVIEAAWQSVVFEPSGYEFRVRSFLSHLIWLSVSHRPVVQSVPSEKSLRDGERIKIMLQYIHDHYAEEINTCQIAGSAMISASECLRCFRSTIGITPIKYVKQYRIQQAAKLLATTTQKIISIGTLCGFQEMSYFARSFKAQMGCLPTEYRKRMSSKS